MIDSLFKRFWPLKTPVLSALIFLSFAIGLIWRATNFPYSPLSLYWDEMAIAVDALSVAETGLDQHGNSFIQPLFISYGDYKLPVIIWLGSLVALFTKNVFWIARLPSLLAGFALLFLLPALAKKLNLHITQQWAILALAAISPVLAHFGRVGFEGHIGMVLLVASLILLLNDKKPWLTAVTSGFLTALATYSYFSVRFVWPVVLISSMVLIINKRRWRGIVSGTIWFLLIVPLLFSSMGRDAHKFRLSASNILTSQQERQVEIDKLRTTSSNPLLAKILYNHELLLLRDATLHGLAHLDPTYLFFTGDNNYRHSWKTVGLFLPITLPLLIAGMIIAWQKNWKLTIFLLLWWMAGIVPAAIPQEVPHTLRSLNAIPPILLFMSIGTDIITSGKWKKWLLGVGSIFFIWQLGRATFVRLAIYDQVSAHDWQDGYLQLARYLEQERDNYVFIDVDSFDGRFFLYYMPYSGMSWSEIQSQPSKDFVRSLYKNVRLNALHDWDFVERRSLLVTTPDRLPDNREIKDQIRDSLGRTAFVVTETEP